MRQARNLRELVYIHSIHVESLPYSADRPLGRQSVDEFKFIACFHATGLENPVVPAGHPAVLDLQRHIWGFEPTVQSPARLTSLTNLDNCTAELECVAHRNIGFRESLGRQIFSEGAGLLEDSLLPNKFDPPGVVFASIVVNRLFGPSVIFLISLLVTHKTIYCQDGDPTYNVLRNSR